MARFSTVSVTIKFGVIFLLSLSVSCDKLEVFPKPAAPFLPAATTEGLNTYGCYVNDSLRVRNDRYLFQADYSKGSLSILLSDFGSSLDYSESIGITATKSILGPGNYTIKERSVPSLENCADAFYRRGENRYHSSNLFWGILEITKLDTINFVIAGKFSFRAINDKNEVVKIDSGRFDLKYIP